MCQWDERRSGLGREHAGNFRRGQHIAFGERLFDQLGQRCWLHAHRRHGNRLAMRTAL